MADITSVDLARRVPGHAPRQGHAIQDLGHQGRRQPQCGQGGGPGGGRAAVRALLAAVAEVAAASPVAATAVRRVAAEAAMEVTGWSGSPTRCRVRMSHVSLGHPPSAAGDLDPARADRARARAVRPPARHLGRRLRDRSRTPLPGHRDRATAVPHVPSDMVWSRPAVTILGIDCPPVLGSAPAITPRASARLNLRVSPGTQIGPAAEALVGQLHAVAPWGST